MRNATLGVRERGPPGPLHGVARVPAGTRDAGAGGEPDAFGVRARPLCLAACGTLPVGAWDDRLDEQSPESVRLTSTGFLLRAVRRADSDLQLLSHMVRLQ